MQTRYRLGLPGARSPARSLRVPGRPRHRRLTRRPRSAIRWPASTVASQSVVRPGSHRVPLLPAECEFAIQGLTADTQFSGDLLPAAPFGHSVPLFQPGVETVRQPGQRPDLGTEARCLNAARQQRRPAFRQSGRAGERGQEALLRQACDDAFFRGDSIAVIARRIGGGFRYDGAGPRVLQDHLRAMRRVAQQMNAARAHRVDAGDLSSCHEERLASGETHLTSTLEQRRNQLSHDCDHMAGTERLQQRGNCLPEAPMIRFALLTALLASPGLATAQDAAARHGGTHHAPGMAHHAHGISTDAGDGARMEGGQSAFAAIKEIVSQLMADPETDWSRVDIEAPRQHLIDMDNVTLRARVLAQEVDDGARFEATSEDAGVTGSIRSMVPAHAATMDGVEGWTMRAEEIPGGAT